MADHETNPPAAGAPAAGAPADVDLSDVRVCVDRTLPLSLLLTAAERAIKENEENKPPPVEVKPGVHPQTAKKAAESFGAVLTGKKWKNGRVLRVRHLDGDPAVHARVERFAREWCNYANIDLQFVKSGTPEIRISYLLDNRSWSYLGTDALAQPQNRHTMHFGWLTPAIPDDEYSRVVIHEFGHALGMVHEHQNPVVDIKWNKPVVYRYYMEQLGWTKADVDNNLFAHFSAQETQFPVYDPLSIMHYAVPAKFTLDGREVGWNRVLSDTDKDYIARVYPKSHKDAAGPAAGTPAAGAPQPA